MSEQASAPVKIKVKPRGDVHTVLSPKESLRKQKEYTIVVTGCTGRGKSTFCNFLSRSNKFKSDIPGSEMGSGEFGQWGAVAADLTGTQFAVVEDLVGGVTLRIIDLPGYLATQNRTGNEREDLAKDGKLVLDEFAKALMHAKDGFDAIFVTLKAAERYSREEELLMEFISRFQFWDHCILLFTHGDKVGKDDSERYGDFYKLMKSRDFPSHSPVLHKMLEYVNKRFVIVESVNNKGDHKYYYSKMEEIYKAVEVVRGKTRAINHPLLKLANKAFEESQEKLYLADELDQEREDSSYIQAQLKQADQACRTLHVKLEREKVETERLGQKLQEEEDRQKEEKVNIQMQLEQAHRDRDERVEACKDLQRDLTTINRRLEEEEGKQIQFIKQRQDLHDALKQKQCSNQDAIAILSQWLQEPQTGPDEFADMIAKLRVPPRETAEPRIWSKHRIQVDDTLTSSAVIEEVPQPGETARTQRKSGGAGSQRKSQKSCRLL